MAWSIKRQWYEGDYEAGEEVHLISQVYGLKSFMHGHQTAQALHGTFAVKGRYLFHTCYVGEKALYGKEKVYASPKHQAHLEFDVRCLIAGKFIEFEPQPYWSKVYDDGA